MRFFNRLLGRESECRSPDDRKIVDFQGDYPICPYCGKKYPATRDQLLAAFRQQESAGEKYDIHVVGCIGCGKSAEL